MLQWLWLRQSKWHETTTTQCLSGRMWKSSTVCLLYVRSLSLPRWNCCQTRRCEWEGKWRVIVAPASSHKILITTATDCIRCWAEAQFQRIRITEIFSAGAWRMMWLVTRRGTCEQCSCSLCSCNDATHTTRTHSTYKQTTCILLAITTAKTIEMLQMFNAEQSYVQWRKVIDMAQTPAPTP